MKMQLFQIAFKYAKSLKNKEEPHPSGRSVLGVRDCSKVKL